MSGPTSSSFLLLLVLSIHLSLPLGPDRTISQREGGKEGGMEKGKAYREVLLLNAPHTACSDREDRGTDRRNKQVEQQDQEALRSVLVSFLGCRPWQILSEGNS